MNEADLADGLGKLAAAHEAPAEASGNKLAQSRRKAALVGVAESGL